MLYEQWLRAMEKYPDKYILVFDNGSKGAVVSFHRTPMFGSGHYAIYSEAVTATQRLNELGIPWVLVNAPDEVAAACGVPVD